MEIVKIFENEDVVLINKDAGILSIPDRHKQDAPNLRSALQSLYGEIFVVHRLDKDTSGIICFAKNESSQIFLNDQFNKNEVEKSYRLVVYGSVRQEHFISERPIKEDNAKKGRMMLGDDGKPSKTEFHLIEKFRNFSHLEAKPYTGRTHQIRVHIAGMGFPIIADKDYSDKESLRLSDFYKKSKGESGIIIKRQALHASKLQIKLPGQNETTAFEAEIPNDMKVLLKILRKYDS